MIVAAGPGSRLRPLSELRPKPALPVRGIPLVAYQLALLAHHGVSEVVINAHHLPDRLIEAARRYRPPGLELHFSVEAQLLGTGGGIRKVAAFLRESDPCLILGGDMIVDADLGALIESHRLRRDAFTLLLRDDARGTEFGTIGLDREGHLRRIGTRFDLGSEARAGVYTWVNVVAAHAFDSLPDREAFGHLDDWIAPLLADGASDIRGEFGPCTWEPVGTPREYLTANLRRIRLGYFDPEARAQSEGTRFETELVIGAGAQIEPGAELTRAVVWDGETVPADLRASDGVFAGGSFHSCSEKQA
ncbi:MAG: sugar phosphate nucleotidyltransferase [Myxococcota bacterium]